MQLKACVVVGQLHLLSGLTVPPTIFRISSLVRFRNVSWLIISLDDFFIGWFLLWLLHWWTGVGVKRRSAVRAGVARRISEITALDLAQLLFGQVLQGFLVEHKLLSRFLHKFTIL